MTRRDSPPCRRAALAVLLAFPLHGCLSYDSAYVKDASTRKVGERLDRQAAEAGEPRISVVSAPTAAEPAAPLVVRLRRTLSGPGIRVATVTVSSYRHAWSPLLVPVGAAVLALTPFVLALSALEGDGGDIAAVTGKDRRRPCEHGMAGTGLYWLAGIDTSCRVADSRSAEEERSPTGRTVTEEEGLPGVSLEIRLEVPGGEGVSRTIVTDGAGEASADLSALFRELRAVPERASVTVRSLPDGRTAASVPLDGETARRLFLRAGEGR